MAEFKPGLPIRLLGRGGNCAPYFEGPAAAHAAMHGLAWPLA